MFLIKTTVQFALAIIHYKEKWFLFLSPLEFTQMILHYPGVFRFPKADAARIAVHTVREWLDAHPSSSLRRVVFDVFEEADRQRYATLLGIS